MLVGYRKDYEKIVMGLLSLVPELRENNRFNDVLEDAIAQDYPVYLWKDSEDNHFIAVVIVEEGEDYLLLRHISFSPSERSGKNVFALLTGLAQQYPDKRLMGTMETQSLITTWERNNER
ncbi:MAG: reductase [Limosilactobacillus sp.]|uniref:reductase n=1 Tax=Limosilactobacillus sp. TaxID=2773925 RepID=UPI0026F9A3D5|nr:reductase [Limosilactobacillus sp.]